jgi:hypothetical protein
MAGVAPKVENLMKTFRDVWRDQSVLVSQVIANRQK